MSGAKTNLKQKDGIRMRRAEQWLRRGKPMRALGHLQRLGKQAWNHPWTESILWRAVNSIL